MSQLTIASPDVGAAGRGAKWLPRVGVGYLLLALLVTFNSVLVAWGTPATALDGYATKVDDVAAADLAVLRIKAPYEPRTEGMAALFHHGSLEFADDEVQRILEVCAAVPTVVDVYLDRPAVLSPFADAAAAMIANFGVTDQALVEVLFGTAGPRGALPFDLPRSDAAVAASRTDVPFDTVDPLFRFGHGLRYS